MLRAIARLYVQAFSGVPRVVWLICVIGLVNRAGTMVLPFLQLFLTEDRAFSVSRAGQLVAVYGLGAMVGAFLGGWFSDRVGPFRAQILILGATSFTLPPLILLHSFWGLAAGLFVASAIAEAYRPAAMASIGELVPQDQVPGSFALLRLAINLGMAIGPAIGGWLALGGYWRLFWADAATCGLAALLMTSFLPRLQRARRPLPPPTPQGDLQPWGDLPFLGLLLWTVLFAGVLFQIFSTFPVYLQEGFGLQEDGIGRILGFNALLIVAFEMPLVQWLKRYEPIHTIAVGGGLLCLGLGLMPLDSSIGFLLFTVVIWTVGEMVSLPMMNVVVSGRAGARNRGRYMGMYTVAFSIAFGVGPAAGAALYESLGATRFWYGIAGLAPLVLLSALALRPLLRPPAPPTA